MHCSDDHDAEYRNSDQVCAALLRGALVWDAPDGILAGALADLGDVGTRESVGVLHQQVQLQSTAVMN